MFRHPPGSQAGACSPQCETIHKFQLRSSPTGNQLLSISYDCLICDASFGSRELLIQHSNIHLIGHSCHSAQCQQLYHGTTITNNEINKSTTPENSHFLQIMSSQLCKSTSSYQGGSQKEGNNSDNNNSKKIARNHKSDTNSDSTSTTKYSNNLSTKPRGSHHVPPIVYLKIPMKLKVQQATNSAPPSSRATKSSSAINNPRNKKLYQCKSCQKVLSSKMSYLEHSRIHCTNKKGPERHKCPLCGKSYAVKNTLTQHMTLHENNATTNTTTPPSFYSCSICCDSFPTQQKLDYHTCPGVNRRGESFRCKICRKIFARKEWRTRHYLSSHSNGESCFRCEICGDIFPDEQFYLIHAQVHFSHEIKRAFLDCRVCGKTFPGKDLYEKHSCRCAAVVNSR
ncbi:zinc finger protein 287-like [Folsomia candida]|uniref:zinc finger protein 287-like n=1 Tax=Folsomia candida TaxID=158441 RepID=UPI0016055688|nr:zinc finger protein 287-like [Folsomia candida]